MEIGNLISEITVPESSSERFGGRILAFFVSLGALICVIGLMGLLIRLRPEPDIRVIAEAKPHKANAIQITRGTHPVIVEVYGTARAAKTLSLQAPISGTAVASSDLFIGKLLDAEEAIFQIDTIRQDLSIRDLQVQLKALDIKTSRLQDEDSILQKRLETARGLVQNAAEAVDQQKKLLGIREQLFANFQELYEKETISFTEFLNRESALREAEVSVLLAETTQNNRKDAVDQLDLDLNHNSKELSNIENEREALEIKITQLEDDREKAEISADFPSQIVELFIEQEQEVTAGTALAIVRSINKTHIEVNVPDSYFRWLYSGDFLNKLEDPSITSISIELVLENFEKHFEGGYLKAIGDRVNIPTRSLPILIERINPTNGKGQALAKEELKPGMYCKVKLELATVAESFIVPYRAIQADGSLIVVSEDPVSKASVFATITEIEVIHEGMDGAIISLPKEFERLTLITDQMRAVDLGARVIPILPEDQGVSE